MWPFVGFRRLTCPFGVAAVVVLSLQAPSWGAAPPSSWEVTRQGLVWQVPEMARARVQTDLPYASGQSGPLTMDLYYPAETGGGSPLGAVVFVNGVGDMPENPLRKWQVYVDWARAVSARGLVGIVYGAENGHAAENLAALFDHLRARGHSLGIDPERLGLYACSANVMTGLPFVASLSGAPLRCAVFFYGNAPADSLRPDLPVLYVRAERDGAPLNQGIEAIWQRARAARLPWTMIEGTDLPHAFDALDVGAYSRALVQQTLDFWCAHLKPLPEEPGNSVQRRVHAAVYGHDFSAAVRILEPIYQGGDASPDVARVLLHCYRNLREVDKGLALAAEQLRLHPELPNLWSAQGALLVAANRPADAAASLEKARALGARDFTTHSQLLMAHLAAGNPAAAVRCGEDAARLFPAVATIHYNLACAHALNRAAAPALQALAAAIRAGYRDRKAIEADPDLELLRGEPGYRELMGSLGD